MNIFITGIRGFVGTHLYEHFTRQGHHVLGIDNLLHPASSKIPKTAFHYGDVRYYKDIEDYIANTDVVIHLAAQINVDKSITNPQETIDINVNGTLNVLEACRKFNKRLVFASSSEVYGSSQTTFMAENHPLDGQSPYAASKTAGDRLCFSYYKTYGLDVRIVRNFNIFGKYQNFDSYGGVIAIFTYRCLSSKKPVVYGDGDQERDYLWIDDAVQAYDIMTMKDNLAGAVVNFGSGKTVSVNHIAKQIMKYTVTEGQAEHTKERAGEVHRLCADISEAKKLGFTPKTDFDRDLAVYVSWFRESYK